MKKCLAKCQNGLDYSEELTKLYIADYLSTTSMIFFLDVKPDNILT